MRNHTVKLFYFGCKDGKLLWIFQVTISTFDKMLQTTVMCIGLRCGSFFQRFCTESPAYKPTNGKKFFCRFLPAFDKLLCLSLQ